MDTPHGEIPDRLARDMRPQDVHDYLARHYSRRALLKAAVRAGALGTAGALVGPTLWRQTTASAGTPAIGPRWLAFGADASSQLRVSWASGTATGTAPRPTAPRVRWGSDTHYGSSAAAMISQVPVPSAQGAPTENAFYLSYVVGDLAPDRTYHYSVSNDGRTWSADATFRTAPRTPAAFRFTAFGDQASHSATTVPMARLVAAQQPAFHLVCGDLAYAQNAGGSAPATNAQFHPAQWDGYLSAIGPTAAQVPWHPAVGAHEVEPLGRHGYDGFLTRFPQAYDLSSGSPVVRAWTYGNVGVVQLDGNDLSAQEVVNTGYSEGGQTAWLADTLAGFRAAGSGVDFVVAVVNCCTYSSNTNHGSDGGLRDAWGPLFDRHAVDLVLSGHVHAYERTNPMRNGRPTREAAPGATVAPEQDGTTYICAGGGGNGLYGGWYGTTLSGDAGSSTGPKVWRWSGGDTAAGGSGRPVNQTDTASDYSACRRAVYSCVVVDVTPRPPGGGATTMRVRTLMPAQTGSAVTSIADPAVIDSVTLTR